MSRIPQEILAEIRERTDIIQLIGEQVVLRRNGRDYVGLCPFHQEKTPSFHVDPDKKLFYCYGCQTGGDAFSFVQKRDNLGFNEATEILAERAGITLPANDGYAEDDEQLRRKRRLLDACQAALDFFCQQLKSHPDAGKARRYAIQRELDPETVAHFQLGYAPAEWRGLADHLQINGYGLDILELAGLVVRQGEYTSGQHYYDRFRDRLIFPIFDYRGRCVAFGGRQLEAEPNQPKYLNSSQSPIFDKSHILYGIHLHRGARPQELVVYEGYMDLVSTWQAGCTNGVASLGTALTLEQCRLLRRYTDRVTLCYDADKAGQAATERGMFLLHQAGLKIRVARVPEGKDPDDYVRLHGGEAFRREVLDSALPLLRYSKENLMQRFNLQTIEGKSGYVREFLSILAKIASPVEEEEYLREVAGDLNLTFESLRRERERIRLPQAGSSRDGGLRNTPSRSRETLNSLHIRTGEGTLSENVERDAARVEENLPIGRVRAEDNLLALALMDRHFAVKLTEVWSMDKFAGENQRALAVVFWDYFRANLVPEEVAGALEPQVGAHYARLRLLEDSLMERDQVFSESLSYLQSCCLREELDRLGRDCEALQLGDDDTALMETLRRMQEVQRQLASLRIK